jgi:hypothetical protein
MVSLFVAYVILNAAPCYPNCTIHIIFVNTNYGSYTQEQRTLFTQQIQYANAWWYTQLDDKHTISFAQDSTMVAENTDRGNNWLRAYYNTIWNVPDLYFFVVYSPYYDATAWTSNNIMVVYVRDNRDISYVFAHELGHLLYHFPDLVSDSGIMGYAPGNAYTQYIIGCQLQNILQNPCVRVYLPMVIK